jgi:tetratricopeptide (TPR) repeat protein
MSTARTTDPADIAARHLTQGRVSAAQSVYADMIAHNPNDPKALGGLGAIALSNGDLPRAMDLFTHASRLAPRDAQAMMNLGVGYQANGKTEQAEACFRRSIELDSSLASAHGNLASLLAANGETDAASASMETAIELAPNAPEFRFNHANLMLAKEMQAAAIAGYEAAIRLDPEHAAARNNLALVFKELGRLEDAVHQLTEARMREPGNPEIQINLADVLSNLGRHDEAEALARHATSIAPANALIRSGYGLVLMNAGNLAGAMAEFAAAVKADPQNPIVPMHMATLLRRQGRPEAALTAADRAAALTGASGAPDMLRADLLLALGRTDEAWAAFDKAAESSPNPLGKISAPLDLEALAGGPLRVLALEPSSLFFITRLMPTLAAAGIRVEILCPPLLESLAGCIDGVASVSARQTIDLHALADEGGPICTAIDLPRLMRITPETGAGTVALALSDDATKPFAERLAAVEGPKIGLWWEGTGTVHAPQPLLDAVPCTPVILQIGAPRGALGPVDRPVIDLSGDIGDFHDLAAAMTGLDAVVTADGPPAHLAAALGIKTFVLAGADRPWFWGGADGRTRWYRSARAFYQQPEGPWSTAIAALGAAAAEIVS